MVALGSFNRRVGANSLRRVSLGNASNGIGGSKKTIYGARSDVSSSGVGAFSNINESRVNTLWSKQPKKGWVDRGWGALVGSGKQTTTKQVDTKKPKEMKVKFMDGKGKTEKDLMVKYNSRKNYQRMEVYLQEGENKKMAKTAFKRKVANEISKEMKKLSRNSSRFKKQQGLSQVGSAQSRTIANTVYKSGDLKNVLNKAGHGTLGGKKYSGRTKNIKIGR